MAALVSSPGSALMTKTCLKESKMNDEIWKDIPGYEGEYQASTCGRIKSLRRKVRGVNPYTGVEFMRTITETILRPGRHCKSGHVSVVLRRNTPGKPVHQLVAITFIGPVPDGKEVLHTNGDPSDNRITNLRYGTRRENILDVYKTGRAWRKLTTGDVHKIRELIDQGAPFAQIAQKYGVAPISIYRIKCGGTFSWLE